MTFQQNYRYKIIWQGKNKLSVKILTIAHKLFSRFKIL